MFPNKNILVDQPNMNLELHTQQLCTPRQMGRKLLCNSRPSPASERHNEMGLILQWNSEQQSNEYSYRMLFRWILSEIFHELDCNTVAYCNSICHEMIWGWFPLTMDSMRSRYEVCKNGKKHTHRFRLIQWHTLGQKWQTFHKNSD